MTCLVPDADQRLTCHCGSLGRLKALEIPPLGDLVFLKVGRSGPFEPWKAAVVVVLIPDVDKDFFFLGHAVAGGSRVCSAVDGWHLSWALVHPQHVSTRSPNGARVKREGNYREACEACGYEIHHRLPILRLLLRSWSLWLLYSWLGAINPDHRPPKVC